MYMYISFFEGGRVFIIYTYKRDNKYIIFISYLYIYIIIYIYILYILYIEYYGRGSRVYITYSNRQIIIHIYIHIHIIILGGRIYNYLPICVYNIKHPTTSQNTKYVVNVKYKIYININKYKYI